MKKVLFSLPILLLFFASCDKKNCPTEGEGYIFNLPVSLSPTKDTFAIGDTITVISQFSHNVYERKTEQNILLENFLFYPILEMDKIDSLPSIGRIEEFFDIILFTSSNYHLQTFSNGDQSLLGHYGYENGIYTIEYQLVTKSPGLYLLRQGHDLVKKPEQDFEGKCKNLGIDVAAVINGGGDNNVDMLLDSPDPHFNDWTLIDPERRFHKMGGYCFYVR
ncbi:MAG: hypothetical protein AAFV80_18170 [Bacteroidota bacterium]